VAENSCSSSTAVQLCYCELIAHLVDLRRPRFEVRWSFTAVQNQCSKALLAAGEEEIFGNV
jgi:hypothetical protein